MRLLFLASIFILFSCSSDKYEWLENIEGEKALNYVKSENQKTFSKLEKYPVYEKFLSETMEILNSKDRIPYGGVRGYYYYNFWQDSNHVRGILRRTSTRNLAKKNTYWETVFDLDKLAKEEKENWVFKKLDCFEPFNGHCLFRLSRGGKDASVIREFDVKEKKFVEGGFHIPEAKTQASWYDKDTLIVGTNWGEGTLTNSGYARVVKFLKRGQKLEEAKTLLEGREKDVSVSAYRDLKATNGITIVARHKSFYKGIYWKLKDDGKLEKLNVPSDSEFALFKGHYVIQLKSSWDLRYKDKVKIFPMGALVAVKYEDINSPQLFKKVKVILEPSTKMMIGKLSAGKNYLYVSVMDNVVGSIRRYSYNNGRWRGVQLGLPDNGSARMISLNSASDKLFIRFESFLMPTSLYMYDGAMDHLEKMKTTPSKFDGDNLKVAQHEAVSKDGTKVPYFLVSSKDSINDGSNPTLLYGYGGFEHAMSPFYSGTIGKLWLERGGTFALSNIRGGGEFGPRWHQAALKENRPRAFEDFEAIAKDLIDRKVTSPTHLGIMGGSNGGLLVGATFVRRPHLYKAVVCQVPLLDMLRFHKLLAGASWMGEYGDPDIESEKDFLKGYSPYHNVKSNVVYPEVFFMTSTKDDRVHPGHARKMVAKMHDMGHPVLYYENTEGGHAGSANLTQRAKWYALEYSFLWELLGTPKDLKVQELVAEE